MTVNFCGFKNSGFLYVGNVLGELPHTKTWTQITNENGAHLDKYKSLLQKYPSTDEFTRIQVHNDAVNLQDSTVSLNGYQIAFDDISVENVKDVQMVRALLKDMADPENKFQIDDAYFNSDKPIENLGFDKKWINAPEQKHFKFRQLWDSHSFSRVKNFCKEVDALIVRKFEDTFR